MGCGNFANQQAIALNALPEQVKLVAVCDRHPERAQAVADRHTGGRAAVYTDDRELIETAGLDLLVITLPPYGHTDEVERAAAKGIHLLIEKPIALTRQKAWQMVAAAEAAGVKTQVGFKFRFGAAIERMRSMIESGAAGQVGLMSARYFANALHAAWWRVREKSGGQIVEQAIHMLDLMRFLMGEPESVYSRQENFFHRQMPDYTIEDVSATVVSFRSGGLGVLYATNGAIPNRWINDYRVVAERLTADFANANQARFFHTDVEGSPVEVVDSDRDVLVAQAADLIQAIRTGGDTRTPIREGARSLDLALAAVESDQLRQEVAL